MSCTKNVQTQVFLFFCGEGEGEGVEECSEECRVAFTSESKWWWFRTSIMVTTGIVVSNKYWNIHMLSMYCANELLPLVIRFLSFLPHHRIIKIDQASCKLNMITITKPHTLMKSPKQIEHSIHNIQDNLKTIQLNNSLSSTTIFNQNLRFLFFFSV